MLKSRGSAKKPSGVGLKQPRCGFATAKKTVSTRTAKKPALKRGPKPKSQQIEPSSDHTLSDTALESFQAILPTSPEHPNPPDFNKLSILKLADSLPVFTGILADLNISPFSPHWRTEHTIHVKQLAKELGVYPKLTTHATNRLKITIKSDDTCKDLIPELFNPVVLTSTLESVVQDEDQTKKHQTVFNTLHGLYDPRWIPPQYRDAMVQPTQSDSNQGPGFVHLKVGTYDCTFPHDHNRSEVGESLSQLLKQFVDVQTHDPRSSRYLAQLHTLATNANYVRILEQFQDMPITHQNQHKIKSELASALDSVEPLVAREDEYPVLTLGRGPSNIKHQQFRFVHPITSMQSFAQFHHLDKHWPGCIESLYPNKAQADDIRKCAKLCHHFFGGYAANPLPSSVLDYVVPYVTRSHKRIAAALQLGLHTVGPPGTGKTALLSAPMMLAAHCNDIPITIALAESNKFGLLTIDTKNKSAKMSEIKSNRQYSQNVSEYTDDLLKTLKSHIPRSGKHLFIIDPMEQSQSGDVLDSFNILYEQLCDQFPDLLVFSAHSTPRLNVTDQDKQSDLGQMVGQYPFLQFTNMELSHSSIHKLLTPVITQLHPGVSAQEIQKTLDVLSYFAVPTIRCYHMLLQASRTTFKRALEGFYPRLDAGQVPNYSRSELRNHEKMGELGRNPCVVHASYAVIDTDEHIQRQVISQFLSGAMPPSFSALNRTSRLYQEDALFNAARVPGAAFEPIPGGRSVPITGCVHIEGNRFKQGPESENETLGLKKPATRQVTAGQLNELYHVGLSYAKNGQFVRFSDDFPVFDLALLSSPPSLEKPSSTSAITSPTHIQFLSVKTGGSRDKITAGLYQAAAARFAKQYEKGLQQSSPSAQVTFEWFVANPNQNLTKRFGKHAIMYQYPEQLFKLHHPKQQVLEMLKTCDLIGQIYGPTKELWDDSVM